MNIHHVLLFSFFSDLCGGNSELIRTNSPVFTGPEGGNGTITCLFKMTGSRKLFCRNECKDEDVLIRTNKISANNGRYSLKYKTNRSGGGILSVTIKHLTQYDSGWYSCGLGGSVAPDTYQDFEIRVSDALLDRKSGFILTNAVGGNIEYPCRYAANRSSMFFCRGECKRQEDVLIETDENGAQKGRYGIKFKEDSALGLYATITQAVKSDSGGYRCGYGRALSPDSYHTFLLLVDDPPTAKPNWNRQIFSTSVPSATRPLTTTTQSLSSSSGSSTTSPVFPETSNQPTPAAPATSKPSRTLQPFATSAPSTSKPPTTTIQSLSSSSGSSTTSPVFPETTNQPAAAVPATSKPSRTLQPFATSVPPASKPPLTTSLSSSSGSSTTSPVFPETTNQPAAADPSTSKPSQTLQLFATSIPQASKATTTQSSSSTTSPFFPKATKQPAAADSKQFTTFSYVPQHTSSHIPSHPLPLVVCVPVVGMLLLASSLLFLYIRKMKKNKAEALR